MDTTYYADIFSKVVGMDSILFNEPMSKHTTYKIGGKCDVMLLPKNDDEVLALIKLCRHNNIPFYVIGNGSNLLVKDGGVRGAIIKISSKMSEVKACGNRIVAQAGALLGNVVKVAYEYGLSGLEFATGIPGAIGGAITMNAGAYGGNMQQVVVSVRACDTEGNIVELTADELNFGYRQSVVRCNKLTVLSCELELIPGSKAEIKEKMDTLSAKRRAMQPLSLPSCGSVFKRPEGYYIGKLIEDAGLKGTTVGGAQVSQLHANFIVNIDNATAKDVLDLIEVVKKRVFETFNVQIETEVIVIGEDS